MCKALVESLSTHGTEVGTVPKKNERKIKAMEMNYWRRSSDLIKVDRVRNEEIRRAQVDIDTVETIQAKRLLWCGHLQRMPEER
jgi:transcription initiation factor IIF auxiliary subunit